MTVFTAEKLPGGRRSGPEWFRHIAGNALAARNAKRAPLSWKDELARLYPPS
ncbi:hypothetical protein [Neoroseomonas soli]|uniref:Uncharacterized protein n=1 Tax=Neoroseomonas soli TaxID=1081025 RepID=A0A9X9X1G1_9PROT|nr:hypothetical protein [Neoroseomonas soli]MBR0673240.1 hypothetical protein [Neoroseomonas soli]